MVDKIKLMKSVKTMGLNEFESLAGYTNADEGKKMIVFCEKEISCKDVNNWGRQESKDFYIGIDESGWIKYNQISQYFQGPFKIMDSSVTNIDEDEVLEYLEGANCTEKEFLNFWSKVKAILYSM